MGEFIIETNKVNRFFPIAGGKDFHALKDISINVPANSLSILRGRSGSGKTTLMNILGSLDRPTNGTILFDGTDITKLSDRQRDRLRRSKIGFIFQSVSLIPNMTAYENVEFSLRLAGYKGDKKARVAECLKLVGLGNRMDHMPHEMSGGEQQRVAIARAIAHKPTAIFADEPTAELDTNTALLVMKIFKELVTREQITIIMTTHDTMLMSAADYIFHIEDGEIVNE